MKEVKIMSETTSITVIRLAKFALVGWVIHCITRPMTK